jgi:hypothetical protein
MKIGHTVYKPEITFINYDYIEILNKYNLLFIFPHNYIVNKTTIESTTWYIKGHFTKELCNLLVLTNDINLSYASTSPILDIIKLLPCDRDKTYLKIKMIETRSGEDIETIKYTIDIEFVKDIIKYIPLISISNVINIKDDIICCDACGLIFKNPPIIKLDLHSRVLNYCSLCFTELRDSFNIVINQVDKNFLKDLQIAKIARKLL